MTDDEFIAEVNAELDHEPFALWAAYLAEFLVYVMVWTLCQ